jgi:hypothetical protein
LVTTYSPVDDGAGAAAQADEDEMSEFDADDEMARASDRDGVGYDVFLSERAIGGLRKVLHGQNLTATLKTFFDRGSFGLSKNRRMFLLVSHQKSARNGVTAS